MDEFLNRILQLRNDDDVADVMEIVYVLFDEDCTTFTDEQRITLFDNLLGTIRHVDNYALDILLVATDVRMIEILLQALSFKIHRSLNSCLTRIKNIEVLWYLVTHPYANFKVGYRQSEPLRFAVLNNEIEIVRIFMMGYRQASIHTRGLTTNGKSAVELAVMFDNKAIIKTFLERGLTCMHDSYTKFVNNYVSQVETDQSIQKIGLISLLNDKYIRNGTLDFQTMLQLLEDNPDPLKELGVTATLRFYFQKIAHYTNGCHKV